MAKEIPGITGSIGPVVVYQSYGQTIYRSKPVQVKQSVGMRARSLNFGVASMAGRALRNLLLPVLPFPKDKLMQSRFSGAICKWLRTTLINKLAPAGRLPYITGFQFNRATGLGERWRVALTVDRTDAAHLRLHIPAFVPVQSFSAPANAISVECRIISAACTLSDGHAAGSFETSITFPYNDIVIPAQDMILPVPAQVGNLVVTAASLVFMVKKGGVSAANNNPIFMPSGIVNAMYC